MKTAVIVFPGSNCDRDLAVALELVTGSKPAMVWHRDSELPEGTEFIGIPGGFSYGDYLRSGAMAARSPVMGAVRDAAARGVPVIGICNGFQVLTEAGLLPGALMRNAGLSFVCKPVRLRVENSQSLFTSQYAAGETVTLPVAHHDGNYQADAATLERLEGEGRVAFRYLDACQRLVGRHCRHPQRCRQRARADAAPGAGGGSSAWQQRRPPPVRRAVGDCLLAPRLDRDFGAAAGRRRRHAHQHAVRPGRVDDLRVMPRESSARR